MNNGSSTLLRLIGGLGLLLGAPVILLAALAIVWEDGFPVFFRQERVGRWGRPFRIVKLRTMRRDTPSLPAEQMAGRRQVVTRAGRVLRALHLDELPQLWNVMRGELALVGPRPALASQEALLAGRCRLGIDTLLPGMTGLAQLVPETAVNDTLKLALDGEYLRRRSVGLDLCILIATCLPFLRGRLTRPHPPEKPNMTMSINWRRVAQLGIDALLSAVSAYAAFCLRMAEFPLSHWWTPVYFAGLGPLIGWRLLSLLGLRVYRIASRHTGIRDLEVIFLATLLSSVLFWASAHLFPEGLFPKSILIIDWFVNFFLVAGLRVGYRIALDLRRLQARSRSGPPARRVLILGAGTIGASLAREMRWRSLGDLALVGFLDDDPAKRGLLLHGAPVLGPIQELRRIVSQRAVDDVIVAIPSATGPRVREIIALCEDLPVRLRISPGFAELENGDGWRTLRDVSVEDLLRRKPVRVNMEEITAYLAGERVLVTGAGGSIGSELVRQIIRVGPKEILLLGHGENSIFEIEQELRRELDYTPTCLIADTRDYDRLLMLFERHRPTVVFHAAAHKHVPLMESNVAEAITNNVLGTRNLARIASLTGVKRFVMVSTDKAVNPTSVMGASKRVAELLIQAESRCSSTEFAIVRFGNVLGSRGSVVPLMRKQIEHGGPVTVTHPQVVRYFMTIPEAVQLLIQAGALGGRGAIYVLDMGEPVRILDLARDLIRLSGLVPGKDITVRITGLRPGEKLYEELLTAQEGVSVTRHERIFCAPAAEFSISHLDKAADALIAAARAEDTDEMRRLLKVLEPGFALPAAPPIEPAVVGAYHRSGDDPAAPGSAEPGGAARVQPAPAKRGYTQPGITRPGYTGPPRARRGIRIMPDS